MNLYESLRTAMIGLTTNKMRAALTMLGIIIGVASVVALMSIGEGVEAMITGEIQGLGSNLIFVVADQPEDSLQFVFRESPLVRIGVVAHTIQGIQLDLSRIT